MKYFEIVRDPINPAEVIAKVGGPDIGAIVPFIGTVREFTKGKRTIYLEYEAYEPMAVQTMADIAKEIKERWPHTQLAMTHRIGRLDIGDIAVVSVVAAPHRDVGFAASAYAIERLKEIVPIWKKENWDDGSEWIGHQKGFAT
jgi:molybdopterin synthase catalytic subunit